MQLSVSVSGDECTRSYDEHAGVAHPLTSMRRTIVNVQLHVRSPSGRICEHAMSANKIWHQKRFFLVPGAKWMCTSNLWTCMNVFGCVRSLFERSGEQEIVHCSDHRKIFKYGKCLMFDTNFHL